MKFSEWQTKNHLRLLSTYGMWDDAVTGLPKALEVKASVIDYRKGPDSKTVELNILLLTENHLIHAARLVGPKQEATDNSPAQPEVVQFNVKTYPLAELVQIAHEATTVAVTGTGSLHIHLKFSQASGLGTLTLPFPDNDVEEAARNDYAVMRQALLNRIS